MERNFYYPGNLGQCMVGRVVYLGRVKQSNYHIHLLYTIPNRVAPRLLYKSVLLLVFGLILWKWMNGMDSLGSNQECRIDYRHSHSRVSHCLASIRKLGNRRSSEGLRSFKPSKGTNLLILIILAGDIEMNPGPRLMQKVL